MSRTLDHQAEWLADLTFLDLYWANTEFSLRDEAVKIQAQLSNPSSLFAQHMPVRLVIPRRQEPVIFQSSPAPPIAAYEEVILDIYRVGGKEETLLIEECLRRAYAGISW